MFIRIRTIKGKRYRYQETRWRDGKKVRSRSVCLGAVDADEPVGWLAAQVGRSLGIDWYAIEQEMAARQKVDDAQHAAHLDRLHAAYGLTLGPAVPVPVEKPASKVDLNAPAAAPAGKESASPDGEADISGIQDQ